ncbi:uncharacterized protein LOC132760604 [Ruditapes philippinarum]|uniref:uncharacterized protein LOC132760604 n=1 Tax=Ruditapes philippinarum TaxID=129788 RepID=UPI00295A6F6D|nr:uncharacterized protein LOC132760604 [Ruditapes philippinarum]
MENLTKTGGKNLKKHGNKKFICMNKHLQGRCPVCEEWLEKNVCQTVDNGHKFHWACLCKMQGSGKRCDLCIEDDLPTEHDCFKLKQKNVLDKAAMRDMAHEIVTCDNCGHVGTFAEVKQLHDERGCDKDKRGFDQVGCACVIC